MPYSPLKFLTEDFVPSRPCANLKGSVCKPKEQNRAFLTITFGNNFGCWKSTR